MRKYRVVVLPGDGIGPEVTEAALLVLRSAGKTHGFEIDFKEELIGGAAIDETGEPLPEKTVSSCAAADAVLLGAVGGPKWDGGKRRPEEGLLGIRRELGLYANLRPAKVWEPLMAASPLKETVLKGGLDLLIVRELTGGVYFGDRGRMLKGQIPAAYDVEMYAKNEIERIARVAFKEASRRKKKLASVDKANVLESSRFWRETITEIHKEYPEVELSHVLVDNAAMQLIRAPGEFDVIVTSNLFGDILSDEASMLTGSIGMLPSASMREDRFGLYEPVHGSAPDIAGKGLANPLAAILSAAMLLRLSLLETNAADTIERAVESALCAGLRTADLSRGESPVSTEEMTEKVLSAMQQ